jgi:hypothetical protein
VRPFFLEATWHSKLSQIISRGRSTWLIRIYVGRDPQTKNRMCINKTVHGGLRVAQAQLNRMLVECALCFLAKTTAQSRQGSEITDLCCCTAEVLAEVPRFDATEGVQEGAESVLLAGKSMALWRHSALICR